jgi:hypothetical protein
MVDVVTNLDEPLKGMSIHTGCLMAAVGKVCVCFYVRHAAHNTHTSSMLIMIDA